MNNQISTAIQQIGHIVDAWIPMKIKYDKTPGISIAISHGGKIIYARGFGFADVAHKQKASAETLYHIASHSKMFTAVAIMKLVEEGKLRLDDHVSDYIDWFKAKAKHSDSSHITLRQLLSHTAGVFRDGDTPHWENGKFPKDLKKSFSSKSLVIENLTTFKYTNYGYSLLGLVIEKASGMSYEEYVTKKILKPLGMKNTYVDYKKEIKHIATGYGSETPDQKRIVFSHYATNAYAPATGFVSNATDLIKFISSLSLNHDSPHVINRESVKEMGRPHAKTEDGDEYGLGLDISYLDGRKIIGHGGGFNGFITRTALDTKNDIGVVVLTNTLGSNASQITDGLLDSIDRIINKSKDYSSHSKISYAKYEGIYRSVWGDSVISRAKDILISYGPKTNNPLKGARRFIPTSSPHTFVMKSKYVYGSYDEEAVFTNFKNGKAQKLLEASMPLKRIQ